MKCVVKRLEDTKISEISYFSDKTDIVAPVKASKILGDNVRINAKLEEKKFEQNGPASNQPKDETSFINLKLYNLDKNVFTKFFLYNQINFLFR